MIIKGIGTDIIEVDRIRKAIERWDDSFLRRIFCDEEIDYASQHDNPYPYYAARFAAKEAVYKAFGDLPYLDWTAIKILKNHNGKPVCHYRPHRWDGQILISLSHTHTYAAASALVTE
ncbi:MAG: holo-ACP synthase [Candidatus Omnitrophota bacterium]